MSQDAFKATPIISSTPPFSPPGHRVAFKRHPPPPFISASTHHSRTNQASRPCGYPVQSQFRTTYHTETEGGKQDFNLVNATQKAEQRSKHVEDPKNEGNIPHNHGPIFAPRRSPWIPLASSKTSPLGWELLLVGSRPKRCRVKAVPELRALLHAAIAKKASSLGAHNRHH